MIHVKKNALDHVMMLLSVQRLAFRKKFQNLFVKDQHISVTAFIRG